MEETEILMAIQLENCEASCLCLWCDFRWKGSSPHMPDLSTRASAVLVRVGFINGARGCLLPALSQDEHSQICYTLRPSTGMPEESRDTTGYRCILEQSGE